MKPDVENGIDDGSRSRAGEFNPIQNLAKDISPSTESELAHQNLIAINKDLQQEIYDLRRSFSYRIGQVLVRLLRPLMVMLGRRPRHTIRPAIAIDSSWPYLRGTITFQQPSTARASIEVQALGHNLLSKVLNFSDYSVSISEFPATLEFQFGYQLGFEEFPHEKIEITIDGIRLENTICDTALTNFESVCRPLDVAIDSIIDVSGDLSEFRDKLKGAQGVALLAMFRDISRPDDNSQTLLDELRDLGLLTIVIDTSEKQPSLPISCDIYIHRLNVGWDFASWMGVLGMWPWLTEESQCLVLVNDSNVGPLKSLNNLFEQGVTGGFDVWGITDSWEIRYHLQSYFLYFGREVLEGGHLQEFASAFSFPVEKNSIIHSGEIGLSQFLIQRGLRLGVVFPYLRLAHAYLESFPDRMSEFQKRKEIELQFNQRTTVASYEMNFALATVENIRCASPINPTHHFWDVLIELGSPFIKRELLVKNPERVPGLNRISQIITDPVGRAVLQREVEYCGKASNTFSLALAMSLNSPTS